MHKSLSMASRSGVIAKFDLERPSLWSISSIKSGATVIKPSTLFDCDSRLTSCMSFFLDSSEMWWHAGRIGK